MNDRSEQQDRNNFLGFRTGREGMRPIVDDFTFRSDTGTYRRGWARPASVSRPRHILYSYIPVPPSLLPDPGGGVHVLSRHTENIADLLPGFRVAGVGPHVADPAFPLALGRFSELFEEVFRLRRVLRLVLYVNNVLPDQSRGGKHHPVEVHDKDIGVLPHELAILLVDLRYPGVEPLLVDQLRRFLGLRDAFVFGCAIGKDATRQAEAEQYCSHSD